MPSNFQHLKQEYDQNGFVIARSFLIGDELQKLSGELDRYVRDVVPGLPDTEAFYHDKARPETLKQMQRLDRDPFFAEYKDHPRWRLLAEALIGEETICQGPEWFDKPPGLDHPTPPHQDNYYFNWKPPWATTLWLALDHVTEENGCLRYVRGSHQHGRRPHGQSQVLGFSQGVTDYGPTDQQNEVKILLQPGDLAAHHGWTVHLAEANRTADQHRRAFAMVYRGVSCRRDEEGFRQYQQSVESQHKEMGLQTQSESN